MKTGIVVFGILLSTFFCSCSKSESPSDVAIEYAAAIFSCDLQKANSLSSDEMKEDNENIKNLLLIGTKGEKVVVSVDEIKRNSKFIETKSNGNSIFKFYSKEGKPQFQIKLVATDKGFLVVAFQFGVD